MTYQELKKRQKRKRIFKKIGVGGLIGLNLYLGYKCYKLSRIEK